MKDYFLNILEKLTGIRLSDSPSFPRIWKNSSWLLLDNIVRLGGGFFLTVWLARYLGPEQFGLFNYAIAFVALFTFFGTLGLNEIMVRNLIQSPSQRDEIMATAFLLRMLGGTIAFGLALVLVFFLNPFDRTVHWLVGIIAAGIIFQAFEVIDSYFQSQVLSKYVVLARVIPFVLVSSLKVFLILTGAPLVAFAWVWLIEIVLAGMGLMVIYYSRGFSLRLKEFKSQIAKNLIKDAWPMILSGVAVMIYMRIDQIMIRHMIGEKAVGIYAAAMKVSEAWYVLGGIIIFSTFPIIIHLKTESEALYREKCRQVYKVLIIMGAAAAGGTILMAKPLIYFLYGEAYSQSMAVLSVQVLGVMLVYLISASTYALVAEGLQKYHVYRTVLGCIVNILLNLILIPWFGLMGAVFSMLCSYCVAVFSILLFKGTRGIF